MKLIKERVHFRNLINNQKDISNGNNEDKILISTYRENVTFYNYKNKSSNKIDVE